MKKITLILITLLAFIYSHAQYVVPRGLPYHDTRYVNYKAPQGVIKVDSFFMTLSHDTASKPLYPAFAYWQNTGIDSTLWVWDMLRWKKLGTVGSTGTITDITGTNNYGFEPIVTGTTTKDIQVSTLLTKNSAPFIGTNGAIRENINKYVFDSALIRLGIGMNAPQATLNVYGQSVFENNYTLNGNVFNDRMMQINDTITSDNGTADRFPRALYANVVTAGSVNINGSTTEVISVQGNIKLSANITTKEAIGVLGRAWTIGTNTAGTMIGVNGQITASGTQTVTNKIAAVEATLYHQGGTITAPSFSYFRTEDTNYVLAPMTLHFDTAYGVFIHNINAGTVNVGVMQYGSSPINVFQATSNIFPNLPTYSSGSNTPVVWNNTSKRLELTSGGAGTGTVTSVGLTMPSAFTVTSSPITSSGTIAVTGAGTTSQYIRGDGTLSTFATDARSSISLTTTGSSGAATYNSSTGVLNVPTYTASGLGAVTSVGLAAPSIFTVTNSPVTSTGTLTFAPNNAQGDLIYGSATNTLAYLNKSANLYQWLSNAGTSKNPSWQPIDTTGVIDIAGYILGGGFGTDTTAAINQAIIDASNTAKKTVRFSTAASPYVVSTHYRNTSSGVNHKGIELVSGITVIIDNGVTIYADTAWTATTGNANIYPLFNGYNVSNVTINGSGGSTLDGQKTSFGNYTTNPYTNPAGYYADTSNRWSTSAIQFFYGDNNKVTNVYAKDFQLMGYLGMFTTNMYVGHSKFFRNGGSGTVLLRRSTGDFEYNICDSNNSDQMRVDSCSLGLVTLSHCIGSNAQSSASATNWFAGIYVSAGCSHVHADNLYLHDNSAYGYDNNSDTTNKDFILSNSLIEYNGNAGMVTGAPMTIQNNRFFNNGKTRAGATDTKSGSGYNPAAIGVNTVGNMVIEGNYSVDTVSGGNWAQTYFIKQVADATFGYYGSTIVDNYIKGVADTAHMRNGNLGGNAYLNNHLFTNADAIVLDATAATVWTLNADGVGRWAVAGGSGGLTVGTSAIASGTTTRVLYDNAGVLGEYTVTGTGTTAVLSTTPTFTTSIITPLVVGGTGTTSTLTLQPTTGVGTTNADIVFKNGNNGATEVGRINNAGSLRMGASTPAGVSANDKLSIVGTTYGYASLFGTTASSNEIIAFNQGSGAGTSNNRFYSLGLNGSQTDANYGGNTLTNGDFGLVTYLAGFKKVWSATAGTQNVVFWGNVGFAGQTPTAYAHFPAGVSGTAPVQFTAGTQIATPVSGTLETNTSNDLMYTNGTATRAQVALWGYIAKSSSYTATDADNTIDVTATGQTITLPTAVGITGRVYTIKLTASGSATVTTAGGQNIDASSTYSLSAQYKYVTVQSNGSAWIIIANN